MTSSVLSTLRNSALGLFAAWRLALARTAAKVSMRVPYFCMYSRPAPPKVRSAWAISLPTSLVRPRRIGKKRSRVGGRSSQWDFNGPACICSKPTASTQSAAPDSMALRARYRAVEPVEQLLLTLITGMPVMPTS
ncbi:hypothetical protein D3C78_1529720 [compost metagenome]